MLQPNDFILQAILVIMTATLLGSALGGHFLQFAGETGTLVCGTEDPVLLVPFTQGQVLYRFGELHHDNVVCLQSLLTCICNCGRHPLTNTVYTEPEIQQWNEIYKYIEQRLGTGAWHEHALEAVQAFLRVQQGWDGSVLHWPEDVPIVSRFTPMLGSLLARCSHLVIPASVETIGERACATNRRLRNVKFALRSKCKRIAANAFQSTSLYSIDLPAALEHIEMQAFANTPLMNVYFNGDRVHTIDVGAFRDSKLREFTVPPLVKLLESRVFYNCKDLHTVTIPTGSHLMHINMEAFALSGLQTLTVPDSLIAIEEAAFRLCTKLRKVTFGKHSELLSISPLAFAQSGLTAFTCPARVLRIGYEAFSRCSKLKKVAFLGSSLKQIGERAFLQCTALLSIDLPDSVTVIKRETFAYCKKLARLRLGLGTIEIGDGAFRETALPELMLPSALKDIAQCAFQKCTKLTSLLCNDQLVKLGPRAFEKTALTEILLPASLETIGQRCFADIETLVTVFVAKDSRLTMVGVDAFTDTNVQQVHGVPATALVLPSHIRVTVKFTP